MNRPLATMLSTLRREWAAWCSMMNFLVHLHDVDFYRSFDEQDEIGPAGSDAFGVLGERSRTMEKEALNCRGAENVQAKALERLSGEVAERDQVIGGLTIANHVLKKLSGALS